MMEKDGNDNCNDNATGTSNCQGNICYGNGNHGKWNGDGIGYINSINNMTDYKGDEDVKKTF